MFHNHDVYYMKYICYVNAMPYIIIDYYHMMIIKSKYFMPRLCKKYSLRFLCVVVDEVEIFDIFRKRQKLLAKT